MILGGHYLENTWKKPQKGNDGLPRKHCPTTIDWAAVDWAVYDNEPDVVYTYKLMEDFHNGDLKLI